MNEHKKLILRALENFRGDDHLRARAAFRDCTAAEMAQNYGQSGQTRAAILAGYEDHVRKVDAAIEWLNGIEVGK